MNTRVIAIVLTTGMAAACAGPAERTPRRATAPVAVTTVRASVQELPSTFEAGGVVRARFAAPIATRVMAVVTDVRVRAGDRVHRGAVLVSLDARQSAAERERAAASLTAAEQMTAAADADISAAQANVVLARATHQRISELAARRSATPHELDQATAALHGAEAQLAAVQARHAAAIAAQDEARSARLSADAALSYNTLTAPFDGVISERLIDPGAMAVPGTPLLTLEDPSRLQLEVRLDDARAAHVRVGDPVRIVLDRATGADSALKVGTTPDAAQPIHSTDVDPQSTVSGTVSEIAHLDPTSHTFLVKVDLPVLDGVRSGSFARARFSGPPRRTLAVPGTALIRRGQLAFVFAVDGDNIAHLRSVSPGAAVDGRIEILSGLADRDLLVDAPPPSLVDNQTVQPATSVARGEAR